MNTKDKYGINNNKYNNFSKCRNSSDFKKNLSGSIDQSNNFGKHLKSNINDKISSYNHLENNKSTIKTVPTIVKDSSKIDIKISVICPKEKIENKKKDNHTLETKKNNKSINIHQNLKTIKNVNISKNLDKQNLHKRNVSEDTDFTKNNLNISLFLNENGNKINNFIKCPVNAYNSFAFNNNLISIMTNPNKNELISKKYP